MDTTASPPIGARMSTIPPSGTIEVSRRVRALVAQGIDVVNLSGGFAEPQPDCLLRPITFEARRNVLGDPAGEKELRHAITDMVHREQNLAYDPETETVVTVGAKQGVYAALLALVEPGDEVLILDPCWMTYAPSVQLAGGVPVPAPLDRENAFRLDGRAMACHAGSRTRAVIITTPHNPTCRVFTTEELGSIADFAQSHNLWMLSDESFDKFVFDGREHVSIASLPEMRGRTGVLKSFSKAYALPGTRVGYLPAPEPLCRAAVRFNDHVITCASPLAQMIAIAALSHDPEWSERLRKAYQDKRDMAVAELANMPGLACAASEGTFYAYTDISATGMTSAEFAEHLLEKGRVAITPGSAFGRGDEGYVRVNFVGPVDAIREGLSRMRRALS